MSSVREDADALLRVCREKALRVTAAESCTGGLLAAALTAIAGASDVFDRGFVTYSNAAKTAMLGVPATLIAAQGAVSEDVARRMAEGAIAASEADLSVAITGIAGPGGGTSAKPVGLVWFGVARRGGRVAVERHYFSGDRAAIREASVRTGLALLMQFAREAP